MVVAPWMLNSGRDGRIAVPGRDGALVAEADVEVVAEEEEVVSHALEAAYTPRHPVV
jgi:hypothetical protein